MFKPPLFPQILHQAWPFIGQYLEKLLVESIASSIRSSNAHLQTFNFTKVDLGDKVQICFLFNLLQKPCLVFQWDVLYFKGNAVFKVQVNFVKVALFNNNSNCLLVKK